jgi:hypothetical protein
MLTNCNYFILKDKKLNEINNKNVLELMTEMLHEQENNYSAGQNSTRNQNENGDKLETDSYSHKSKVNH